MHAGTVSQHMQAALIGILSPAGLRAHDSQNHYDPHSVEVECL